MFYLHLRVLVLQWMSGRGMVSVQCSASSIMARQPIQRLAALTAGLAFRGPRRDS